MTNQNNLVPNHKRTPEELRRITRKGGIRSGESRRRNKKMREMLNIVLNCAPPLEIKNKIAKSFPDLPEEDITNSVLLLVALFEKACKGDINAFKIIRDIVGESLEETQASSNLSTLDSDSVIELL